MIKSMTGYGEAHAIFDGHEVIVQIRSVNHRFLEFGFRTPSSYFFLNEKIKTELTKHLSRGKVDVSVTIIADGSIGKQVAVDYPLAQAYYNAAVGLAEQLGYEKADVKFEQILAQRDVMRVSEDNTSENEEIWGMVSTVLRDALADFLKMRVHEGENIIGDIRVSIDSVREKAGQLEIYAEEAEKIYYDKLYARLKELLESPDTSESRLLTETAIFADKTSVNEEIVRLVSHAEQMEELLLDTGAIGRKMDFLAQEMNREINTVGAKAQHGEMSRIVVDVKAEIEKIREQIQNVE